MALPTLLDAAPVRLISASNRIDTARPAASSSGETILEPEERRARDLANIWEDSESIRELLSAEIFVLITITASVSSPAMGGLTKATSCRVVNHLQGHSPSFPIGLGSAANRRSCDNGVIDG